ncbi:MAG: acyltransferase family protein [Gammaproteobacteria bacterium]
MKKISNIQGLRGIAVLLVAFFHLMLIEQKYDQNAIMPKLMSFGISGVDLFFVISGFVIVTVTRNQFRKPASAFKFLYHRVSRIYPLYWIYSALVLVLFLLKPTWVNSAQGNRVDVLSSFLLLPQNLLPLINVGWSLVHEMYFYGFYFLLMLTVREAFLPFALILWGSMVLLFQILCSPDNAYWKLVFHPLTLEFIGGCFIAIFYHANEKHLNRFGLLFGIAFGFALLAANVPIEQITERLYLDAWWWRITTLGLPSLLIVHGLVQLERHQNLLPRWLVSIGDASYSMYLSHVLILSALGRIWRPFSDVGMWDNLIALPVLITSAIAFARLSYHLLEKPIVKTCRRIA